MKPNETKPQAYENILAEKPVDKKADVVAGELVDMCTLQYYCPQPIVCARLAHAYVPFQCLCCLYSPEEGLKQGTIFPELARPYGKDPEYVIDA